MPSCAVVNCGNNNKTTKGTDIKYHKFPKDPAIIKRWLIACERGDKINLQHACMCSIHFEPSCFVTTFAFSKQLMNYTPKNGRTLKPDAVPTLNLPNSKSLEPDNLVRVEQLAKRRKLNTENSSLCFASFNVTDKEDLKSSTINDDSFTKKMPETHIKDEIKRENEQLVVLRETIIKLEKEESVLLEKLNLCQANKVSMRFDGGKVFFIGSQKEEIKSE